MDRRLPRLADARRQDPASSVSVRGLPDRGRVVCHGFIESVTYAPGQPGGCLHRGRGRPRCARQQDLAAKTRGAGQSPRARHPAAQTAQRRPRPGQCSPARPSLPAPGASGRPVPRTGSAWSGWDAAASPESTPAPNSAWRAWSPSVTACPPCSIPATKYSPARRSNDLAREVRASSPAGPGRAGTASRTSPAGAGLRSSSPPGSSAHRRASSPKATRPRPDCTVPATATSTCSKAPAGSRASPRASSPAWCSWSLSRSPANCPWPLIASLAAAAVFTVVRLVQRKPLTQALAGIVGVGISAWLANSTGKAEDFYVLGVLHQRRLHRGHGASPSPSAGRSPGCSSASSGTKAWTGGRIPPGSRPTRSAPG